MCAVEAYSQFVDDRRGNRIVMREGDALILLRLTKSTGNWRASIQTEAIAIRLWRRDHVSRLIGAPDEHGLLRSRHVVEAEIRLVARDRRRKIYPVVLLIGSRIADVLMRH